MSADEKIDALEKRVAALEQAAQPEEKEIKEIDGYMYICKKSQSDATD